ncbi:hypothetical protein C8Q80DRAFT_1122980 [Daedaleopsis nitida]|nr:hypothetical protein C8Q80DRAFT_1122980 [Daedaleopsis nitida]
MDPEEAKIISEHAMRAYLSMVAVSQCTIKNQPTSEDQITTTDIDRLSITGDTSCQTANDTGAVYNETHANNADHDKNNYDISVHRLRPIHLSEGVWIYDEKRKVRETNDTHTGVEMMAIYYVTKSTKREYARSLTSTSQLEVGTTACTVQVGMSSQYANWLCGVYKMGNTLSCGIVILGWKPSV